MLGGYAGSLYYLSRTEFASLTVRLIFMATSLNLTEDILPLTDFKRNTGQLAEQMKSTGRPLILTINGRAELVVQDAAAYQALVEAAETLATLESVRRGAAQIERGEGVAVDEAFQSIRKRRKSK